MKKSIPVTFFYIALLLLFTLQTNAQIFPAENSKINYLIAGFNFLPHDKSKSYLLEIADGVYIDEKEFSKKIIIAKKSDNTKIIAELPEFGKHYTWRVKYLNKKNKPIGKTSFFHFATNIGSEVDTSVYRMRVLNNSMNDSNLLIMTDSKAVIYNLKGKPVWFWPDVKDLVLRDFKATKDGTFTFLSHLSCFEVDYNGNILWKVETELDNDSGNSFHHDLTKLSNGNYMVCGQEYIYIPMYAPIDSSRLANTASIVKKDGKYYRRSWAGTLIEFDKNGKEVWKWRSAKVIPDTAFFSRFPSLKPAAVLPGAGTHMNAFYFDETKNVIYVSFRNINTILKIKYPSGELVTSYGQYKNGNFGNAQMQIDTPFLHQHAPTLTSKNELLLFDNNDDLTHTGQPSKVVIFNEPQDANDVLNKIFEFSCDIDTNTSATSHSGGNALELPDQNILACMGFPARIFIINRRKELLWNAITENTNNGKSSILNQYRVNYIYIKDISKFIFK